MFDQIDENQIDLVVWGSSRIACALVGQARASGVRVDADWLWSAEGRYFLKGRYSAAVRAADAGFSALASVSG